MNGVINVATGKLLRAGFCDFAAGAGEAVRSDVPDGAVCAGCDSYTISKWTGTEWLMVEDLSEAKRIRCDEIDTRTRALIDMGFSYAGHQFSLSDQAQMNIVGLKTPVDQGWVTFPHKMSTIDDLVEYELPDVAAYYAVYATAVSTIKTHYDSGRALKKIVMACTTVADVLAVEDTR